MESANSLKWLRGGQGREEKGGISSSLLLLLLLPLKGRRAALDVSISEKSLVSPDLKNNPDKWRSYYHLVDSHDNGFTLLPCYLLEYSVNDTIL